jgi:hypothetical protein
MNNDYWKILCERINDLIEIGVTNEEPFHNALKKELKNIYNWPSQHIKHKPPVKIGSETKYPDIVLEGDGFGIIIEVKAPGIILGDDQAGQLIAYMSSYYTSRNSVKCKYGLLIGGEIKVYFQNDPNKKPQLITSFGFDVDSSDGNSLSEVLFYDVCSDEKLKKFIDKKMEEEKIIRIKNDLLMNNGTKIKEIVKTQLISNGYEKDLVDNIFKDIIIKPKNEPLGPNGENGEDEPDDDEKKKAYKELEEIKPYFEAKGFKMGGPGVIFGKHYFIFSILRTSGRKRFAFAIIILGNKYRFEYYTNDKEEAKNMEKNINEIKKLFPNADFRPGRGEEPWPKIRFEITDPREQAFNIIERTRGILGF